jgi:acyl-CoA reductase-like NAD-dependent aldehyde dehydrogenase
MGNHRYRLDREGVAAVAAAWWAGEHPGGPAWADVSPEMRAKIVLDMKGLLKRRRVETPGDLATPVARCEIVATLSA